MGRSVWVATVSFCLILALYLYCDSACRRVSDGLMQDSRHVEALMWDGKKDEALVHLRQMERAWETQADFLSFFVDHQQIDRVSESLRTARIALDYGREYEVYSSLSALEGAAESLYEADAFVLKNIW